MMYRLRNELYKRIVTEMHGRLADPVQRREEARDRSASDVAAAYRERDLELLISYDRFFSVNYGTLHTKLAAGALRKLSCAPITERLSQQHLKTATRVGDVLRETGDPVLWKPTDDLLELTAAVLTRPDHEEVLLEMLRQRGVPSGGEVRELLKQAGETGQFSSGTL